MNRQSATLASIVFGVALLLHVAPIGNYFADEDSFNYVLEAHYALNSMGSPAVEGGSFLVHQNLFRLLGTLSFVLRYALFDMWMPGWNLFSVLLHGLNAVLVMWLAAGLGLPRRASVVAGALFAVSPLHPHVVAWLGGTFDLLCTTFVLASLLFARAGRNWASAFMVAGAMMSKEPGILAVGFIVLFHLARPGAHWREVARSIAPAVLVTVVVAAARAAQVALAGSVAAAGLPGRTIVFDPLVILDVGPRALLAGLGAFVQGFFHQTDTTAHTVGALSAAAILLVGLWLSPHRRLAGVALLAGFGALLPVLLLRDVGLTFGLEYVMFSPRYLYLPLALATPALAAALSPGRTPLEWIPIAALLLLSAWRTGGDAVREADPLPVAPEVIAAIDAVDREPTILVNRMERATFRALLSRWYAESRGARVRWVQRGSWRIIERDPARTGLDFMEEYLRIPDQPFRPDGKVVPWLLQLGGVGRPFEIRQLPPLSGDTAPGDVRPLSLLAKSHPTGLDAEIEDLGADGLRFRIRVRPESAQHYRHRAQVRTARIDARTSRIWGVHVTYSVQEKQSLPTDRGLRRGYLEVHWGARDVSPSDAFVTIPVNSDGEHHTARIPLWFDPVFRSADVVQWFGIHPLDDVGVVTVHGFELVYGR